MKKTEKLDKSKVTSILDLNQQKLREDKSYLGDLKLTGNDASKTIDEAIKLIQELEKDKIITPQDKEKTIDKLEDLKRPIQQTPSNRRDL